MHKSGFYLENLSIFKTTINIISETSHLVVDQKSFLIHFNQIPVIVQIFGIKQIFDYRLV